MEPSTFYPENPPLFTSTDDPLLTHLMGQGELLLLKGDLSGLELFEKAIELEPLNADIFYRQGLALFEYGSETGREKTLLVANKKFKKATLLCPHHFEAWHAWGNTLALLGMTYQEHHYFLEAAEKLKKALARDQGEKPDLSAELLWDYAAVWTRIAKKSQEACDFQIALDAFQKSCNCFEAHLPAEFWNDFASASIAMAKLLGNTGLHIQAIHYFKRAISLSPTSSEDSFEGWKNLALALKELYVQTQEEDHFTQANACFASASNLTAQDDSLWLEWASLLCISGRNTKNLKRLKGCLEKCKRSFVANPAQPLLIAVWAEALALIGELSERLDFIYEAENKITEAENLSEEEIPALCFSKGMCLNSFGKYFGDIDYFYQAIEQFQAGVSIDRTSHCNWQAMAKTYTLIGEIHADIDAYEKARKFYAKAIALYPSSFYIFDYALTLLKLGEMQEDKNHLENAITQFEKALNLHKNALYIHPEWLFHYALALDLIADFYDDETFYFRSIDILSHVLVVDPDFPKLHHRLALAFSHLGEMGTELEHFYRALHHFRLASKYEEDNDQIILDWGVTLINIAQTLHTPDELVLLYQEAEHKITTAAKLGNEQAYYHLACLYSLLEQYERSLDFIKKSHACKSLPPIEEVLEDEWLEGLRSTSLFQNFLSSFR